MLSASRILPVLLIGFAQQGALSISPPEAADAIRAAIEHTIGDRFMSQKLKTRSLLFSSRASFAVFGVKGAALPAIALSRSHDAVERDSVFQCSIAAEGSFPARGCRLPENSIYMEVVGVSARPNGLMHVMLMIAENWGPVAEERIYTLEMARRAGRWGVVRVVSRAVR